MMLRDLEKASKIPYIRQPFSVALFFSCFPSLFQI